LPGVDLVYPVLVLEDYLIDGLGHGLGKIWSCQGGKY
jgi:hypothetical protein